MGDDVTYECRDRVATVTLNRPRYRNAQSRRLLEELDAALERAVGDAEVRVIVLRGEGDHFSSGHDLGTPEELADRQARPWPEGLVGEQERQFRIHYSNTLRWRDLPKPTIAAVQGFCIYGGWMIASAMDLIVASEDARFLPAHTQYFSVPWDLGPRRTKELLWKADFATAAELHELGMVSHVVPRDQLDTFTAGLAADIARQDPFVAAMIKRSVNEMQDHMGFRTSVAAAFSTFLHLRATGKVVPQGQEGRMRRLPGVARSLGKEEG
jgi:enoyl-CoA hydratase